MHAKGRALGRAGLRAGLPLLKQCDSVVPTWVCLIDLNACFTELLAEPAGKCAVSKPCGAISSPGGCLALSNALEVAEIHR